MLSSMFLQAFFPVIRVQDFAAWKIKLLALQSARGEIAHDIATKVGFLFTVRLQRQQRIFQPFRTFQSGRDVEVVIALDRFALVIMGFYRPFERQHLGQGRQPLLAVQNQQIRAGWRTVKGDILYRAHLKIGFAARFQQHDRAHRERSRHTNQQAAYMVVVPHPTPLEVGKLNLAFDNIGENFRKQAFGAVERTHQNPL